MRIDRTLPLVRQGYPWAPRLRAGAGAVPTRLMGRVAAVVGGPEGVRRFYDPRLRRRDAFPPRPTQDLGVDTGRMPTRPRSGVVLAVGGAHR